MSLVGLSLKEILDATNGKLISNGSDDYWFNFSKDTRTIENNSFYIPIKGENFNGNEFINDAFEKGATGSFIERGEDVIVESIGKTLIEVKNSVVAIADIANIVREKWGGEIIVVTGSAGKTTTKEIIAGGLSKDTVVYKTPGNLNNLIGVPITLLNINKESKIAVIELGMSYKGEIAKLSKIVNPQWGVITNVLEAHLENFINIDEIAKEKGDILNYVSEGAVVPVDYKYFKSLCKKRKIKCLSFGNGGDIDIQIEEKLIVRICDNKYEFENIFHSKTEAMNFALSLGIIYLKGGIIEDYYLSVKKNYIPPVGRMSYHYLKNIGVLLIDDSYNANPGSVKAAIDALEQETNQRKILVIGDMLELGEKEEFLHREIGRYINSKNFDIVIAAGKRGKWIYEELEDKNKSVFHIINHQELAELLNIIVTRNSTILIKASRGMNLDKNVKILIEEDKNRVV